MIRVVTSGYAPQITAILYDVVGKNVGELGIGATARRGDTWAVSAAMPMARYPSGVYWVVVKTEGSSQRIKIALVR